MAHHRIRRHGNAKPEQITNSLRLFVHQWVLVCRVTADADANQGNVDVVAQKPGQQAAVRARAAGANNDFVNLHALVKKLLLQLLRAGHIAQAANRV